MAVIPLLPKLKRVHCVCSVFMMTLGQRNTATGSKKGAKLMLYSNEKLYTLPDQEEAMKHVGHEVEVTATLTGDGALKNVQFKKKEEKA